MPEIRPFRALRYDAERVAALDQVVAPPYDVISPARRAALAGRDPYNIVHVDLPVSEAGEDPAERYARAGRLFDTWRTAGILRRDTVPALYVHEQTFVLPGSGRRRVQRGFYASVRLEPLGPGSGILPHERTMSGPKEDRLRLMRATSADLSGIVALYADRSGTVSGLLDEVAGMPSAADVVHDDGVASRLWVLPHEGATARMVGALRAAAGAGPITIADGHHRYETALRYRDERRAAEGGGADDDAPFDHVLMLLLDTSDSPPVVLPTHRVVRGLGPAADGLLAAARSLFSVAPADRAEVVGAFGPAAPDAGGRGRFGLWTRSGGAILEARREAFGPHLPDGGPALQRLDVTLLAVALERLAGVDREATAGGGRIAYTHSAEEAVAMVEAGEDGAGAAFLLEPTRAVDVAAVAAEGDVMPQKSTFFFPKPLTGLVIHPLEG